MIAGRLYRVFRGVPLKYRMLSLMTAAQTGASVMQQAMGVLAPFLIAAFALNARQLGTLFTALYLGSALFTAIGGILTDRLGERTMVAVSGGIMTLALVAASVVPNYIWLVLWIFVYGAGYASAMPAGGRAILMWFTRDRGFAMGIRQTGVSLGGLVGAIALPLAALHFGNYRAALLLGALLVAIPTAIAYALYRESAVDLAPPGKIADLIGGMKLLARDPRLLTVTATCTILMNAQVAMNGFLTVTAIRDVGASPTFAASAFACAFVAAGSARLFWGWFSDRVLHGKRIALMAGLSALSALATFLFALLPYGATWLLVPSAVFLGLSTAGWNGVMAAALAEIGGADRAASATGLTLTSVFGVSAFGPLIFGAVADHTTLQTAWFLTSALALAGMLPIFWLRGTRYGAGPRFTQL